VISGISDHFGPLIRVSEDYSGRTALVDVLVRTIVDGRDAVPLADREAAAAWLTAAIRERRLTANPHVRTGRLPLAELRRQAGLTQSDFATVVGISRRSLVTFEATGRIPRLEAAYAIAAALGLDSHEVVRLSGAHLHGGSRRTRERLATTPAQVDGPLIGARLRQAREAAGLTQQALADALGIQRKTLWAYEVGRFRPRRYKIFAQRIRAILDAARTPPSP
jgi:DNA-binding XRE family transcriptional regulator